MVTNILGELGVGVSGVDGQSSEHGSPLCRESQVVLHEKYTGASLRNRDHRDGASAALDGGLGARRRVVRGAGREPRVQCGGTDDSCRDWVPSLRAVV